MPSRTCREMRPGTLWPGRAPRLLDAPVINPFKTLLRTSKRSRKRQASAILLLQRIWQPLEPKTKGAKTRAKPLRRKVSRSTLRPTRPEPGTFVDGLFSSPHGKLAYKLYTPTGSSRRRLPLVVMLHGCGQSAADFAVGTDMNKLADERGFLVLYPQQSTSANLGRCWNWHSPLDQKRGSGEPAIIAALTAHIISTSKANSTRVYIAGISAGGAAAAIIAAAYPDLYIAAGVHSGLAVGEVRTLRGALSAMRNGPGAAGVTKTARPPPCIVFHGDQDRVVHPSNASGFLSHLLRSSPRSLTSRTQRGRSSGGREFTRTVYGHGLRDVLLEDWTVHGSGHAWSGGSPAGSHTDPAGPDASREMIRFFLARKRLVAKVPRTRAGA